ncbi:MAG: NADPH-dependent F420 reductase [Halobacteriales archaeon]
MRIAILGGTGDIGEGLALRWARDTDHEIVIGSRDAERGRDRAADYEAALAERGVERAVEGGANPDAAEGADAVVLAVPPHYVADTVEAVADRLPTDAVLVSPAVGIGSDEAGLHYNPPPAGSVTAYAAEAAPEDTPVVGAFHNLAAGRLADLDEEFEMDTLLVGDDEDAVARVATLAESIEGLRALRAGGIANAPEVESLTPLLVNLARENEGLHDVGVRFF